MFRLNARYPIFFSVLATACLTTGSRANAEHQAANPSDPARRPKVWIFTDMSDPSLHRHDEARSVNDPDDVSAMAGYLLMANEFETLGIVVTSTHRKEHASTPNQAAWANEYFGDAYKADLPALNQVLGGYPSQIIFTQSCIKETAERFDVAAAYRSLSDYASVRQLYDVAQSLPADEKINVLCWGSLTEPAILVKHCLSTDQSDVLRKLRFIAHWTNSSLHQGNIRNPEQVANCREDASACRYMKAVAAAGTITYHECGAIGQHGIVSGSPKGKEYFDRFRESRLGSIFVDGKFAHRSVDHSDSATYWVLLGNYGVSLEQVPENGTNPIDLERRNESIFRASSQRLHDELLRRCNAVAKPTEGSTKNAATLRAGSE